MTKKVFRKLAAMQIHERLKERKKFLRNHNYLLLKAGPAWYQELSPNQKEISSHLVYAILDDLIAGTVSNTKESLSKLGLLPRPNLKHIKEALNSCCQSPIEFLLILYNLINPERKKYSINDRLLLSAVVHLTMMDTLRELHIRIPSPPPVKQKPKVKSKKEKVKTYCSPYLEPYTYKRKLPEFDEICPSKHIQHPESPYFSYMKELKSEVCGTEEREKARQVLPNATKIKFHGKVKAVSHLLLKTKEMHLTQLKKLSETIQLWPSLGSNHVIDEEIINERNLAQKIYQALTEEELNYHLLTPSKYLYCPESMSKGSMSLELVNQSKIKDVETKPLSNTVEGDKEDTDKTTEDLNSKISYQNNKERSEISKKKCREDCQLDSKMQNESESDNKNKSNIRRCKCAEIKNSEKNWDNKKDEEENDHTEKEERQEENLLSQSIKLKRFFIFSKFRDNSEWQMEVLKKALKSLADDDWPLAKLPECYKLPHFRLWMQMRCRKFWTQEDKDETLLISKRMWRHVSKCTPPLPSRRLLCTRQEAEAWANPIACKKFVDGVRANYYKRLRVKQIHHDREFFPTTFQYEFPFPSYPDTYFAYIPSKEEAVFCVSLSEN